MRFAGQIILYLIKTRNTLHVYKIHIFVYVAFGGKQRIACDKKIEVHGVMKTMIRP